ncbi:MAG: hypothetical protein K8T91_26520 [Planctomycetes bacterium]|nr:hypothetical protein [Planctomycetota bacterium]
MKRRSLLQLSAMVLLVAASGADCPNRLWHPQAQPAPEVFSKEPTLADVIAVVNANRSLATSIYANRVTLSGGGFPAMRATMAVGTPRQVRLRAGTGLTGQELDLGSNEELFWIWVKRSQPPSVIVGRHDAFATSPVGRAFPVRPEWLVEAIGLVYLDPQAPHVGPIRRPDGRLEIHTPVSTPAGQNTKVLVVDGRSGLIYEQHLLDERGQRIASASGARHFRDPLEQWTKPNYPGYPEMDVTTLTGLTAPPVGAMPPGAIPPTATPHSANARYAPPVVQPLWPLKR